MAVVVECVLRPMIHSAFVPILSLFLIALEPGQSQLSRAKTLIEANCLACPGRNQAALEEGIRLALKERDARNTNRAAALRLLVDGHATLSAGFPSLGTQERNQALKRSGEFLKELRDARPNDPNIRYESVHRFVGNVEIITADIDERIREFRRILVLAPGHENAQFDLAGDLIRKGQDDEAVALLMDLTRSRDSGRATKATERLTSLFEMRSKSVQVYSPARFSGEVSAGKVFERGFGPGLVFRLSPMDDEETPGWVIVIESRDSSTYAEYSWVLTPPYRGMNPRYLHVGYGQSASDVVNGGPHRFRFVRNLPDYDRARQNVSVVLGRVALPAGKNYQDAFDESLKNMEGIPYCTGSLKILDSHLGTNPDKSRQFIDWIKFEVELCGSERY
jgi:hypothetical protein